MSRLEKEGEQIIKDEMVRLEKEMRKANKGEAFFFSYFPT